MQMQFQLRRRPLKRNYKLYNIKLLFDTTLNDTHFAKSSYKSHRKRLFNFDNENESDSPNSERYI